MEYKTTDGRYGPIYHLADGVRVVPTEYGTWQLIVNYDGNRRKKSYPGTEQGLKEALERARMTAVKLGLAKRNVIGTIPLISEVASKYLENNRARWSEGTIERYSGLIRDFINPAWGSTPLNRVNRKMVKELLVNTLRIRSAKHVEVLHAVISGIFNEAIDNGDTEENPASGLLKKLLPPKRKRNESAPDPFRKDELERLLEAAWKHLHPDHALIIETGALTGMRLGEVLAMRADHLDAYAGQYMVSERVRHGKFGKPKDGEKRLIDIPESLARKLEAHIKSMRKEMFKQGQRFDLLFPGITHGMIQRAIKRACFAARLRVRSPHDLRHTYATILLMQHVSPAYVQKQLGHHSISMTVDIYGRWIPGEGRPDLDMAFSGGKPDLDRTLRGSLSR